MSIIGGCSNGIKIVIPGKKERVHGRACASQLPTEYSWRKAACAQGGGPRPPAKTEPSESSAESVFVCKAGPGTGGGEGKRSRGCGFSTPGTGAWPGEAMPRPGRRGRAFGVEGPRPRLQLRRCLGHGRRIPGHCREQGLGVHRTHARPAADVRGVHCIVGGGEGGFPTPGGSETVGAGHRGSQARRGAWWEASCSQHPRPDFPRHLHRPPLWPRDGLGKQPTNPLHLQGRCAPTTKSSGASVSSSRYALSEPRLSSTL